MPGSVVSRSRRWLRGSAPWYMVRSSERRNDHASIPTARLARNASSVWSHRDRNGAAAECEPPSTSTQGPQPAQAICLRAWCVGSSIVSQAGLSQQDYNHVVLHRHDSPKRPGTPDPPHLIGATRNAGGSLPACSNLLEW